MASLRTGYGLPARPNDGIRTRRPSDTGQPGSIPRPANRVVTTAQDTNAPVAMSSTSKLPSRVPQPTSAPRQSGRPAAARRPSLEQKSASWGSTSTNPSNPPRQLLRRKQSSVSQIARPELPPQNSYPPPLRTREAVDSLSNHARKPSTDNTMLSQPKEEGLGQRVGLGQSPVIYPELDRYRHHQQSATSEQVFELPYKLSTQDLPPPTPASLLFSGSSSQLSASPSTKYSESPGPGSYSRDTTPTSMSSQSPGMVSSSRFLGPKPRQLSPALTRPPVTRRRAGSIPSDMDSMGTDPQGLAAVRESTNSSSSSSTVKDGDRGTRDKKSMTAVPPPVPNPPPRKSSQKFRKNSSGEVKTTIVKPRSGSTGNTSSQKSAGPPTRDPTLQSPTKPPTPRRPSRDGTPDIHSQLLGPAPVVHSNLSSTSLPAEGRRSESNELRPTHPAEPSKAKVPEPPRPATRTPSPNVGSSFRFPFFGRKKTAAQSPPKEAKEKKALRKGPAAGTGHEGYGRFGAVKRRSGSSNLSRGMAGTQSSQESLVSNDPFFADRLNPVVIAGGEIVENRNHSSELSRTTSDLSLPRPSTDSANRTTMWPSPNLRCSPSRPATRRPSDSSDSEGPRMKPTLAYRRSIQRLGTSPENPLRLPQPINTGSKASSPMTSFDTSIMSDDSHYEMQREVLRGRAAAQPVPKKLVKRERSPRKWNLFGRSQKQAAKKADAVVNAPASEAEKKPPAFYTLMDNSDPDVAVEADIHDVLRNADIYVHTPQHSTAELSSAGVRTPEPAPAPPRPAQPATLRSGRPSRLQQVGRIPKVVSNRQPDQSPKSFSRPFRASLQSAPHPSEYLDPEYIAKGPSPPQPSCSTPELTMEASTAETAESVTNVSSSCDSQARASNEEESREFLRFSPRKNSEGTVDTSSSSGMFSLGVPTAIIPRPEDPPAEDEVWNEFDDLLGEDQPKQPASATSSRGTPFHLETFQSKLSKEKPMESPTLAADRVVSSHSLAPTASSCYSADMTERIRNAFQPHPSPPMEPEVDEKQQQDEIKAPMSVPARPRRSLSPIEERNSVSSCSSSEDGTPLAQVNLRVGSMTVSKWLTFGHVLFSDVRHELVAEDGSQHRRSILVIDGLGNDDWSFYAAETYPKATFYNLSPRAPLPTEAASSPKSFPLSPPNHHQVQYFSHDEKFPFAAQSFTSVVYRFPVAAPESHYRNILSEARRVLKPGGYLELSILDVDLNNMGTRGRRAVRQLKERIHAADCEKSLASASDLLVKLIASAGFYDVKAARVGVPVASPITRGHGSSIKKHDRKANKGQPSLSDMMSDESAGADESITKMVSRVGRWWYSRCYESATSEPTSLWNDKALLRECEELGTSLKLMVCCGRAPERVLSV
ncbi:uncharacterized protein F5Z01DRAFT_629620 [Emericellopsis atlantica]|uniref:Methyltransferase type 11 domain-containing protein n=1 Tax=Emericellopsis atlantica TaxID=2614577 RepID=A0A9P8CKY5_9HYPO|nr:uncharacterized protein F5Z01DRAFT_629620 [Emericellopsis atlantica]KAG9250425.1 hypothetical protein F5Z01DRAFT_629620 [Emericellopsis atlantica]